MTYDITHLSEFSEYSLLNNAFNTKYIALSKNILVVSSFQEQKRSSAFPRLLPYRVPLGGDLCLFVDCLQS